jgi:hypothetical protein
VRIPSRIVLVSVLAASSVPALIAAEWRRSIADAGGGGKFSSLQVDANGNAQVAYVDELQGTLKYGFWDSKLDKWFTTALDISSGFCSLVLDSAQHPHISYIEHEKLKYAHWNGSSWEKQPIHVNARHIDYYNSITLDLKGRPSITFYEVWGTGDDYLLHLRRVTREDNFWTVRTVDGTRGSGKFNSAAADSRGRAQIAYANVRDENASLRYARWNGESWEVSVLEGGGGANFPVYSVNIMVDAHDVPHIAYTDTRNRLVKYATRRDGKWQFQVVDAIAHEGYPDRNGVAVDDNGDPYVSYYDEGAGVLKLAHRERNKWVTEVVDSNGAGFTSSLRIVRGEIYMTYYDATTYSLKFAHRPLVVSGSPGDQTSQVWPQQ